MIIYSVFGFLISSYYLSDVIEITTLNAITLPIYLVAMAICAPLFFWISYKQGAFQKHKIELELGNRLEFLMLQS